MQIRLPQVDKLLRDEALEETLLHFRRSIVLALLRDVLEDCRENSRALESAEIIDKVKQKLAQLSNQSLKKVINGTGVVLNTNLGRAPIAIEQIERLKEIAGGYCNLEINLETGKRGKRSSQLDRLVGILTGAESSICVNNNAAAVVLAVNCFVLGKEVIVSRGELIEIGGSFRLPDVIEAAGGKLREVGTTNKTRLSDFEKAIGENTGMIMRCHRSNFEVRGFTEETSLSDLAKLCRSKDVILLEDLGSGVLIDLEQIGLKGEPTVAESIASGCDLVSFSGDKLLGGPQAGLIAGKRTLVEKLAKHPLYRALRLDKISISLLEQTLSSYLYSEPQKKLPSLNLIAATADELAQRVALFIKKAEGRCKQIELISTTTSSAIGGGSLPGKEKESNGIILRTPWKSTQVAQKLRRCKIPVITITRDNDNLIDFRTVFQSEEGILLESLIELEQSMDS